MKIGSAEVKKWESLSLPGFQTSALLHFSISVTLWF